MRSEYLAMNLHDRDIKKQAYKEGALQKALETAKKLLIEKIPIEVIARTTDLSVEVIEQLQKTCCT